MEDAQTLTLFSLAKDHLCACLARAGKLKGTYDEKKTAETLSAFLKVAEGTDSADGIFALFAVLGLDDFERTAVTFAFLGTVDVGVSDALAELGSEHDRGYLTPYMLSLLWHDGCRVREILPYFACGQTLPSYVFGRNTAGALDRMFPDERLISYILGETGNDWYAPLSHLATAREMPRTDIAEAQRIADFICRAEDRDQHALISVSGCRGSGKRSRVLAVCCIMGQIPVQMLDFSLSEAWERRDVLLREALLNGAVPAICGVDESFVGNIGMSGFLSFLNEVTRVFPFSFLLSEKKMQGMADDAAAPVHITEYNSVTDIPDMERSVEIWREESENYPITESVDFFELAGEFRLTPAEIKKSLESADTAVFMAGGSEIEMRNIKEGCYSILDTAMGGKAVKIRCLYGWDDLVLPDHAKGLLHTACDQVRYRYEVYQNRGYRKKVAYGKGVSMAFSGPPGTGKTMAAQVVGGELGLNVYRVDLAAVVSKYIGETEKNLNEIFEQAKKSQVVLFFDEADVLFSKRTEVKDANDKYNNMEAAFLLQKMEEYDGITILATNAIQNFDEAFKRRLRFLIDFPFPGCAERKQIWQKVFPAEQPLGALDYEYLATKFELSGSNIRNIALHAAFLAAADGSEMLEMKHLVRAVRNEFAKSGKVFTGQDAGEYYMLL